MPKSLLIVAAILLLLLAERVAIGAMTRSAEGRRWIVRHWFLHPNAISVIRIPMGLASVVLLWLGVPSLAILWFAFWMITDLTDGTIARCCDLTTETGKWLDPFSDKCMYFPVLLYFAVAPLELRLPLLWVLALIAIDTVGQASRLFSAKKAANYFGKGKTALITILLSVLGLSLVGDGEIPFLGQRLLGLLTVSCTILAFLSLYCKIIPDKWYANSMTLANFVCGIAAICRIHAGEPVQALILVFAGQIFDLFDGRLARRFGSTRRGPMYDDIADGTSFGFALGYLVYSLLRQPGFPGWLAATAAGLYVVAVLYRLYRFLHPTKEMPRGIFQGMPAPAGAMLAGSSALLFAETLPWVACGLVLLTSGLLVSSIPYRHFGQHMWPSLPRTLKLLFGLLLILFVNLAVANRHYANSFRRYCFLMAMLYAVGGVNYRGTADADAEELPEDPQEG